VLEDNDVLHLASGGYGIYNTEQHDVEEAVPRVLLTLQMEVEQIMKVRLPASPPANIIHK
jgi:glucosamine--fructose-6-phosphate aminotransferase (isomerizing)